MGKYIDAEKLIAEIERKLSAHDKVDHLEAQEVGKAWNRGHRIALEDILEIITSLQQERQDHLAGASKMVEPEHIADVSNMMEQPEVELDNRTIMEEISKCGPNPNEFDVARHFFELGRARKEE